MDDDIVVKVANSLPKYNHYLLKEFTEKEVNNSLMFIETVFSEAVKQFDGEIQYVGLRILTPEERVNFELQRSGGGVRIAVSELILVEYQFMYDRKIFKTHLYMPYIKDDCVTIKSTRYNIQRTIVERVFSRTNDGIAIKVIRQPIQFSRTKAYRLVSAIDGSSRVDFVIICELHQRKKIRRRNAISSTILHYLLCRFGYLGTLEKFGLNPEDFQFVPVIGNDTDQYDYFAAKKSQKKTEIYLRVKRTLLDDQICLRFVSNLLYTLTAFDKHSIADLYESTGIVYRIMIGRIIYGEGLVDPQYKSHGDFHITSTDTYLDPDTRNRLHKLGIVVEDIYDLFQYVFIELIEIMINSTHSNLYTKRIDVIHNILTSTIGSRIFNKIYTDRRNQKRLTEKDVGAVFRFNHMMISDIYKTRNVTSDTSAYGDNWLTAFGISKTRQGGLSSIRLTPSAPENRFHPSIASVETLVAFSKTNPGVTGAINPFLEITEHGDIIQPDDSEEIDKMLAYLPYK